MIVGAGSTVKRPNGNPGDRHSAGQFDAHVRVGVEVVEET
jgi:hypothetical protein